MNLRLNLQTGDGWIVILLLVGIGLIAFYTYVYYREGRQARQLTTGQVWTLRLLRIIVALLAVFALTKPAVERTRIEQRPPVVGLLIDESMSMEFPDARENPLVQSSPASQRRRYDTAKKAAQQVQAPLAPTHRVRLYGFSNSLRLLKELPHDPNRERPSVGRQEMFEQAPEPRGNYSNHGDAGLRALHELLEVGAEKLSGLVLFSDGRLTGGESLKKLGEAAAARGVPIHTVTLGSEFPLRDLRIDEVNVAAEASLGDVLLFDVRITNQIEDPLSTELTLLEGDVDADSRDRFKLVGRRRLELPRGARNVTIACIPEVEGERQFRIELPVKPEYDEINEENNSAVVTVKVVKRTLKVLLVAGEPSREYIYMVPALLRDPVIDLSCYLQAADVDYVQQGNSNVEQLPRTTQEWSQFDVAILCDVDPNQITLQQIAGLENMVKKGGGLMIVAGRTQGLAKLIQVHAANIRGLLPVEIDKNRHPDPDQFFLSPFRVQRTSVGRNHPIMLVSSDAALNDRIWTTFPEFFWRHPVIRPKPKAIVLLETAPSPPDLDPATGKPRYAQVPSHECLMAIHRYGDGAVLYCGLDSLWLWRYPYESYDYDRYWTRAIRYLGESRLMGTQQQVSLTTDRRTYSPGQDAQINLRILDPALLEQLRGQSLFVSVTSPAREGEKSGGDVYMVPMRLSETNEPVFLGSYRTKRVGTMRINARQAAPGGDTEAKPLFDVSHSFQVRMQSLEDLDTSADLAAMKELSEMTGGQHFDYRNMSRLDSLAPTIPTDPKIEKHEMQIDIWDGWTYLLLFLVLISTEWSLRKWWGLL